MLKLLDFQNSRTWAFVFIPLHLQKTLPPSYAHAQGSWSQHTWAPCKAKPPKTDISHAGMHEMNEESQTHILGSTSLCSSLDEDAPRDAGSRFTLAFPSMIYLAVGLPVLGLLGLAVTCAGVGSPSVIGLHSTVLESIIYGIAASLCMRRMKKTISSKNLNLATARLHAFVAEFKVDWREVSGQEGCKYLSAWLMTVLILIVARCLGAWWRLRADDAAWDVHHEVLLGTLEILCLIVYGLSSGLVMAAAYTQSHLLLGLDKSLDCWCSNIMAIPDFKEGVRSWNVLQALLKCVGRELAGGFLILQAFGYLCFIFFLVSGIIVIFRHLPCPRQNHTRPAKTHIHTKGWLGASLMIILETSHRSSIF